MISFSRNQGINIIAKRMIRRKVLIKSWPNDWVPLHWNRPEDSPGYLDPTELEGLRRPEHEKIRPKFRVSDQLKHLDVNSPIRKSFSSDHASNRDQSNEYIEQELDRLGLIHKVDFDNSLEAKIIHLSFRLKRLLHEVNRLGESRWNGKLRLVLNSIKYRRLRYLCDLKEQHKDRYERLVEILKIEPTDNKINVPYERPYRKIQMRKLALEYAQNLKEKKVEEYVKSLEEEKKEFEIEKEKTLSWIREQEMKLGITV